MKSVRWRSDTAEWLACAWSQSRGDFGEIATGNIGDSPSPFKRQNLAADESIVSQIQDWSE
jgi:hypothetical protein